MLVFALANPTPYTLARAGIYEAAIMGGVAFTIAGLWFGYRALGAPAAGRRSRRPGSRRPASASGSRADRRLSLIPTIAALAVLTGFVAAGGNSATAAPARNRARLGAVAAALLPAGAIGIGLLVCNYIRFGSWTEFGRSYVMTYPLFVPGLSLPAARHLRLFVRAAAVRLLVSVTCRRVERAAPVGAGLAARRVAGRSPHRRADRRAPDRRAVHGAGAGRAAVGARRGRAFAAWPATRPARTPRRWTRRG